VLQCVPCLPLDWTHDIDDQLHFAKSKNLGLTGVLADAWEPVFWSCELQASPVNETLKLWTDMGGVRINSGNVIVQVVHKALSEPTAVIKVCLIWPPVCTSHSFCTTWSSFELSEIWSCFVILGASIHVFDNSLCKIQRYIADLGRAWPVLVVCGGIVPLLLSITWLILVCYFVGVITWLTIILLNVVALFVTLFFYVKGTYDLNHNKISYTLLVLS
jgi:choline transporter-like protein 2/4/5